MCDDPESTTSRGRAWWTSGYPKEQVQSGGEGARSVRRRLKTRRRGKTGGTRFGGKSKLPGKHDIARLCGDTTSRRGLSDADGRGFHGSRSAAKFPGTARWARLSESIGLALVAVGTRGRPDKRSAQAEIRALQSHMARLKRWALRCLYLPRTAMPFTAIVSGHCRPRPAWMRSSGSLSRGVEGSRRLTSRRPGCPLRSTIIWSCVEVRDIDVPESGRAEVDSQSIRAGGRRSARGR